MGQSRSSRIAGLTVVVLMGLTGPALAGGLTIPLVTFLSNLVVFILGLGLVMFTAGAASWAYNYLNSPHTPMMSGAVNLMVAGGIFAGSGTIALALGLTSGAVL